MKPEELEIEPLLNARDVSKILRCSLPHVYKMADRGQLPCIRWESPGNGERRPRTVVWSGLKWTMFCSLWRIITQINNKKHVIPTDLFDTLSV
jgi:hypothetical protein